MRLIYSTVRYVNIICWAPTLHYVLNIPDTITSLKDINYDFHQLRLIELRGERTLLIDTHPESIKLQ